MNVGAYRGGERALRIVRTCVRRTLPALAGSCIGLLVLGGPASASTCKSSARATSIVTTYIEAQSVAGGDFCPVGGSLSKLYGWTVWETTASVKVNGMVLTPAAGTSIRIDRSKQTLSTFDPSGSLGGPVSGSLPVTSSLSIPLGSFVGIRECHSAIVDPDKPAVPICITREGISWDFNASPSHEIRVGKYSPPAGMDLGWLPISGNIQLRVGTRKSIIALNLVLPNWFSSTPGSGTPITGGAEASVTNAGKVKFEGAHVSIPSAYIGSVEIANLYLSYKASPPGYPKGLWTGKFKLRGLPGGGELDATGDKPYGIAFAPPTSFEYAGAKFTPGSPILIANNVFLANLDASFHRNPFTVVGKGKFLVGPSAKTPAVGIDAGAMIGFGTADEPARLSDLNPVDSRQFNNLTVYATGKARLFDKVDFASGHVLYVYPAFVEVEGNLDYTIMEALNLKAHAKAAINFKSWDYYVSADASLCTGSADWIPGWARNECAGGDFIVSSKGIGGCIRWWGPDVGGYYLWSGSWDFFFHGCDVSGALSVAVSARRSGVAHAAASIAPLTVTQGQQGLLLGVKSSSGVPSFDLVAPSGRRIEIPGATGSQQLQVPEDVKLMYSPQRDHTVFVTIARPEVGAWRVLPRAGSPTIASVKRGSLLPEPRVEASIAGSGRQLQLNYSITDLPGQTVDFIVKGNTTFQSIGSDNGRGGTGTINFTPDSGPAGQRQIIAVVRSYNTVRRTIELDGFDSPGPIAPSIPQVQVKRSGSTVTVSWSGAGMGDRASITAQLSDGRSQLLTTTQSSVTFTDVDSNVVGVISVRFVRNGQLIGPEALAQLGD